jgi:hypothetical protein
MADLNFIFMVLFVMILMALGIANFVQAKSDRKMSDNFFGLLYIIAALALILYKIQNR